MVGYIFRINAGELDYAIYLAQRAQRTQSFLLIVVVDKYRRIRDADLSRVMHFPFSIFHFQFIDVEAFSIFHFQFIDVEAFSIINF